MTDEELIARLRQHDGWVTLEAHTHLTAADRIEALTAKVKLMDDLDAINGEKIEALIAEQSNLVVAAHRQGYDQARAVSSELRRAMAERIMEHEAKLAKAMEGLEKIAGAIEGYNQTLPDEDGLYWDGANAGLIAQEIVSARATLAEIKGETK